MTDLKDGESVEMQGSARTPYVLKNIGGVYSCTCPAWRNQSLPIERRTCKHLRRLRSDQSEQDRIGELPASSAAAKVTRHAKYVTFQLAEVAVPRKLFAAILDRIARLAIPPPRVM